MEELRRRNGKETLEESKSRKQPSKCPEGWAENQGTCGMEPGRKGGLFSGV